MISESSFNLFNKTFQVHRYVTLASMVMRRHQSVEKKQNSSLAGSFVGIETHRTKIQQDNHNIHHVYKAPSSFSLETRPSTSSTLPPPVRAGGSVKQKYVSGGIS